MPPVVFLTILSVPLPVFVNEHVTVPPTPTVKLPGVPESHPEHAMALFKRAQVAVLLHEADAAERITAARRDADAVTRPLIENERLFASY